MSGIDDLAHPFTAFDGTKYYKAVMIPILKDTDTTPGNGSPLRVRTVMLDQGGAIVENTLCCGYRRVDSHSAFARGRMAWVRPVECHVGGAR